MSDCTKTMDFNAEDTGIKTKRKACFDKAKVEYKKFDNKDLDDAEIGAVLEEVAINKGSDVFATCFEGKTTKDDAAKTACAKEASKEVADRTGAKAPEAASIDLLAKLKNKGEEIAAEAKRDCLAAGASESDCIDRFKMELQLRTGLANVNGISNKDIADAQRKRDEADALNAFKAFTEQQKTATCAKTTTECAKDKRDALGVVLSKQFGGKNVDPLAVEKFKQRAGECFF
jgi:hypothetical protein